MEKKTIGAFIAALRKANGMTQKDLAELLHISDKTISRWERGDGVPDLEAVPAIAEIFGISCDELLRGARKRPEEPQTMSPKGEKQRQHLLAVSLSGYQEKSFIAMGISVAGLIAAMVGNFGFLRAYIGFFAGTLFYLASVICQAVLVNGAFLTVSDSTMDAQEAGRYRWAVVRQAQWSFGLTVALLGFSLPLVLLSGGAYVGLDAWYWFGFGAACCLATLLVVLPVCGRINRRLLQKGICCLPEGQEVLYAQNTRLRGTCIRYLVVALGATLVLHAVGMELIWTTEHLSRGTTFDNYEEFISFMETEDLDSGYSGAELYPVPPQEGIEWYDEFGNPITEEAITETLKDSNGNVVCTYLRRNDAVVSVRYTARDGTVLPITVVTQAQFRAGYHLSQVITLAWCLLYPVEVAVAIGVYLRRRRKENRTKSC